ncbi:MAG TPA: hypothetical protein VIJ18_04640 [Microbacteriaceae bacterium]
MNCQGYAYAELSLFGRTVPPHRSSELWADRQLEHVDLSEVRDLDLVLFDRTANSWGAHVVVALASGFLHLSAEVGRPTLWQWCDFADRERYQAIIGAIRIDR